jgi:hypothetical protein
MYEVTDAQSHCFLANENADYVHVRYSGAPNGSPGEVFDGGDDSSGTVSTDTAAGGLFVALPGS